MKSRIAFLIVGVCFGISVFGLASVFSKSSENEGVATIQSSSLPKVSGINTGYRQWKDFLYTTGTVYADKEIQVSAEVDGVVASISVASGRSVQAGELLLVQDAAIEEADLSIATYQMEESKNKLKRVSSLRENGGVSEEQYDNQLAEYNQAEARVMQLKSIISKKHIEAPFSGRLGITHINIGEYLGRGETIVSLYSIDKAKVEFKLPQSVFDRISEGLEVVATIKGKEEYDVRGVISAVSPTIDRSIRAVHAQAVFDNRQGLLRPGMFVELAVSLGTTEEVLVVPVSAVLHTPLGPSVFVLNPVADHYEASPALVDLGAERGDFVEVVSGLELGKLVVSTGAFKVYEGQKVQVDNSMSPEFNDSVGY